MTFQALTAESHGEIRKLLVQISTCKYLLSVYMTSDLLILTTCGQVPATHGTARHSDVSYTS